MIRSRKRISQSGCLKVSNPLNDAALTGCISERVISCVKATLTIEDVQHLDRFGRFSIVIKRFKDCDEQCQQYLMEDEHHYVRSAAVVRYARVA